MIFKRAHMEDEWKHLVSEGAMLVPVVQYALVVSEEILEKDLIITQVFRSEDEQRQLCERLKINFYRTVHSYWRGVDLRVRIYSEEERLFIRDRINAMFKYRPGKDVAVYHDVGAGAHIHLQAPALHGTWNPLAKG